MRRELGIVQGGGDGGDEGQIAEMIEEGSGATAKDAAEANELEVDVKIESAPARDGARAYLEGLSDIEFKPPARRAAHDGRRDRWEVYGTHTAEPLRSPPRRT